MHNVISYKNFFPNIDSTVFVAPTAFVIGNVYISKDASVWYNSVLRGDVGMISVGEGTNIQDNTVIHVDRNYGDTQIGKMVTVGHSCILHACQIHDYAFVGMGSVVMDKVIMEENTMLASGSLVTKGKIIKSGELWAGRPAKFFRMLSEEEINHIKESASNYIQLSRDYLR
ncbi:hexapeptide transferase family protein [Ehrlichia chaffeensis str. Heartland]|uniref:Hexapeptide transferase family protein n=1 Tax=Ehrlichia chaffeensis (strain ATCC CRL-10679 / Arkansas) TaxID=205920 RepID=Q2GFD2_EHRCR|nr:gamma carbonic anhydrase family protein [Ehrlichia chaffeensis]ABD44587.1 hexapeptide transferase family protein [Ehrlichia chaffeensis str. Arkansas]AHX03283.1 hexapeptide transferase family protein [Ehrlichia chaffeensis str. Heartland]AHX05199.1 hexapeptide transferase family protein [Ehrlichia chaffeensis str. Jax]AHX06189.1 hexapeptide transferase family protein [Ehrlichia chaffeensis str. Liberty]AHX07733.1 hexapeptide transferase family protein [Ehrlichia chaffeensis str. Osceola]